MQNILNYAQGLNANEEQISWLEKVLKDKETNQSEVEHIIDYLVAENPKIKTANYEQVKGNCDKWLAAEIKKGNNIKETDKDTKVVLDFKNGFKFVKLVGQNAYKREGFLMSHCVASYYSKDDEIYSLRDEKNLPHATLSKSSQQIKGKGNGSISPKYITYVVQFLEHLKIEVRDNEMLNLGYLNVEKFKEYFNDDTLKGLFKEKYHYRENKMIDKDGKEFASLELLDLIPLVSETKTSLKVNFDLKVFIPLSIEFLFKQTKKIFSKEKVQADSGNYAQLASSGDSVKLASSGDSAQLASSGDSVKLASSGDSVKLASSGDSAQLASSGNYAQLASSGDSVKLASSGDSAQLASSGNYAQLASSGNYAQLASSGNYAKLELNGNDSVGAAIGIKNIIKGKKGNWITLAEYDEKLKPICVKSVQIDGVKIKEDTWYKLENKKFVIVK